MTKRFGRRYTLHAIVFISIFCLVINDFVSFSTSTSSAGGRDRLYTPADLFSYSAATVNNSSSARFDDDDDDDDDDEFDQTNDEDDTLDRLSSPLREEEDDNDDDKLHLIHVMNPYTTVSSSSGRNNNSSLLVSSLFDPLGLEQWLAFESIQRALTNLNLPATSQKIMTVDVVCAIYESDLAALASLPCRKVLLQRSTQEEYPYLKPPKKLPFLQEILDVTTSDLPYKEYYWLYTNSDIGVSKYFYRNLIGHLEGRDAISINRVTIPSGSLTSNVTDMFSNSTTAWFKYIDQAMQQEKPHPGYDCFIVHSSVLERINLGDFFAGHPPWGANFHLLLRIMAENYVNIKSNRGGTFHLGNERTWHVKGENVTIWDADTIRHCPARPSVLTSYSVQNAVNCGRWFYHNGRTFPSLLILDNDDDDDDNTTTTTTTTSNQNNNNNKTIPGFVQPGYEAFFLNRSVNILNYTESGHPVLVRGGGTTVVATIHTSDKKIRFMNNAGNRIGNAMQPFTNKNRRGRFQGRGGGGGGGGVMSSLQQQKQKALAARGSSSNNNDGTSSSSPAIDLAERLAARRAVRRGQPQRP